MDDGRKFQRLLILGMHRSGTSAMARILGEAGLRLSPDEHLMPAADSNPDGHFEDLRLVAANDIILSGAGANWFTPPDPARMSGWDSVQRRCAEALDREEVEVLKDPRLCLTLPCWGVFFPPATTLIINIVRDPIAVASSLERRDGFALSFGQLLWSIYVRSQFEVSKMYPSITVLQSDLRNSQEQVVAAIHAAWESGLKRSTAFQATRNTQVEKLISEERGAHHYQMEFAEETWRSILTFVQNPSRPVHFSDKYAADFYRTTEYIGNLWQIATETRGALVEATTQLEELRMQLG